VEQSAATTALAWTPLRGQHHDLKLSGAPEVVPPVAGLLVASDASKLRMWDLAASKGGTVSCVRTAQGPTTGGNVTSMVFLASHAASETPRPSRRTRRGEEEGKEEAAPPPAPTQTFALAYATDDRVLGLIALPIDGSPYGVLSVAAHDGPVTALSTCSGGAGATWLFSAGLGGVCCWRVHENALRQGARWHGGASQFAAYFRGGEGGGEHADFADAFAFAQVHAQGESVSAPRLTGPTLTVLQLPSLVRCAGYFPTAWEEALLMSEASACATQGEIDLPTAVRLLVNHRPLKMVTPNAAEQALRVFAAEEGSDEGVAWETLARALRNRGEALSAADLDSVMAVLLKEDEDEAGSALLSRQLTKVRLAFATDALAQEDPLAQSAGAFGSALPDIRAAKLDPNEYVTPAFFAGNLLALGE
jgi:hypothetical protein